MDNTNTTVSVGIFLTKTQRTQQLGQKLEQIASMLVGALSVIGILSGALAVVFPEFSIWLGEAVGWCADLLIGG